MGWSNEAEQGLPPQRHREPAALRRDILDELSDHLTLAAERESESGAQNDQQVRKRVLDKFGNPADIARTLWWGAMKETIMKDWIQISINAIVCIAVLGVLGFMALFYRQMQTTNTALIDALNNRPSAAEELYPSVEFIFHRGAIDGPPVEGVEAELHGQPFNEEWARISDESDSDGSAMFGPFRAGQYTVTISDERTELMTDRQITLYANNGTKTIHVAVPPTTQVSLDITAPSAQQVIVKDFRLIMSMQPEWLHEGDRWWGYRPDSVIVTSEGIFRARMHPNSISMVQPEERITQTYGNRLTFKQMGIAQSHYPQNGGDEWFKQVLIRKDFIQHDLQPDGPNRIQLDLPDELLDAYGYHLRLSANTNHGLPERFAWFPEAVSEEFTDFVIDEARLVEHSLFARWDNNQYNRHHGSTGSIEGKSGQLFLLENAPRSLPDGYRLLLASQIQDANLRDLGLVDVNLCAYLDAAPMSLRFNRPTYNGPPQLTDEPFWKLDADSLPTDRGDILFIDLTDAISDPKSFGDASGVFLKWEAPSRNSLQFVASSSSPVWLIMKPIADDAPANEGAD